jgi:hypothetical protein
MRDALAIAGRWIVGAVSGLAMLVISGCAVSADFPRGSCPPDYSWAPIKSDRGTLWLCLPDTTKDTR